MTPERQNTAYYIALLKSFPPHKKSKRRQPHLKVKHLDNQKVFFEIFIQKITSNQYNTNDKIRRLKCIPLLPQIFAKVKPKKEGEKYIFFFEKWLVVIKKEKETLHLLSIYPS